MSERASIFRNTLVSYLAFGVAALVGFALLPFLIRSIGEEAYGVIAVSNAVLEIAILVDLGTRQAAARQFAHFIAHADPERANGIASTAWALYLGIGAVLVLVISVFGADLLALFNVPDQLMREAHGVLLIAGFALVAILARAPYDAALASQLRHDLSHFADVVSSLLRAAIVVALFLLWKPWLLIWPFSSLVAALIAMAWVRSAAYRQCPGLRVSTKLVSRRALGDIAGFSAYTTLLRIADWVGSSGTPLLLSALLGPIAVAHYAPAVSIVILLQPLARSFVAQLVPVVARAEASGQPERIRQTYLEGARYGLLTTGAAAALAASLAPALMRFWLGPGFEDTARVLIALCLGEIAWASACTAFPIWVGTGRIAIPAALALASSSVGLAVTWALVHFADLGVAGAAIGIATAHLLRTASEHVQAVAILRVGIGDYLKQSLIGPCAALAAGAGSSLLVQSQLDAPLLVELPAAAASGGLVLAVLAWTIGLRPEDRTRLLANARGLAAGLLGR